MSTRAQQIELLAVGVLYDGAVIDTPYAKFLAAGTTDAKNAWDDADKSVSITKKALDSQGRASVYGDGIYKIQIYSGDPDSGGVLKFTVDNYKVTAVTGNTRTVTAASVTGSVDDSLVTGDTTSNNIAYYLPDAALMAGKLLQIAKSVAANTLTVYPKSGSGQLVNGAASVAYTAINSTGVFQSDGSNWRVFQTVGDATTLGGYGVSVPAVAGTIPARNGSGEVVGDLFGNATTCTLATNASAVTGGARTNLNTFHGRVDSVGAAVRLPSGWTSAKLGTGDYEITHSLGTANYTVLVQERSQSPYRSWAAIASPGDPTNKFEVRSSTSTSAADADAAFSFIVFVD